MPSWIPFPNPLPQEQYIEDGPFYSGMNIRCTATATAPNIVADIVSTQTATLVETNELLDTIDRVLAISREGADLLEIDSLLQATSFAPTSFVAQPLGVNPWSKIPVADLTDPASQVNGAWLGWLLSVLGADFDFVEVNNTVLEGLYPDRYPVTYVFNPTPSWVTDIEPEYATWDDNNQAATAGTMNVVFKTIPGVLTTKIQGQLIGLLLAFWGEQPFEFFQELINTLVYKGLLEDPSCPILPKIDNISLIYRPNLGWWTGHRGFGRPGGMFDVAGGIEDEYAVGWSIPFNIPEDGRYTYLTCQNISCGTCSNLSYTWLIQTEAEAEAGASTGLAWYSKPIVGEGCSLENGAWVYCRDTVAGDFETCNLTAGDDLFVRSKSSEVGSNFTLLEAETFLSNNQIAYSSQPGSGFENPPSDPQVRGEWLGWLLSIWGTPISPPDGVFNAYTTGWSGEQITIPLPVVNIPDWNASWGALLGLLLEKWGTNSTQFYNQLVSYVRNLPPWDTGDGYTFAAFMGPFWNEQEQAQTYIDWKTHTWTELNPPNPTWMAQHSGVFSLPAILWYPSGSGNGKWWIPQY